MNNAEPLVSVVIPTYNRASLLVRAIESVLAQTHRNLEVIVVDDRSPDDTPEVVSRIRDPRVRLVTAESRLGVADARNNGIEHAAGRYICFLDDDDEWLEPKVKRQLAAFSGSEPPALVYTGLWIDDGRTRRSGVMELGSDPFERLLTFPGPVTTSAFMIDRDRVGDELWFDRSVTTFEDGELILRISRCWPVAVVPEPLYVWHQHDGRRLSEPRAQVRARRRILEKFSEDLAVRPRTAANLQLRLAMAESHMGDWVAVRSSLQAASAADPSDIRLRLLARLAVLGPGSAKLAVAGYRRAARLRLLARPPRRAVQGRAW